MLNSMLIFNMIKISTNLTIKKSITYIIHSSHAPHHNTLIIIMSTSLPIFYPFLWALTLLAFYFTFYVFYRHIMTKLLTFYDTNRR